MKNIKDLKISSVIACYKDEQSIPIMHKRLIDVFKKLVVTMRIIFVNDGSPDGSEKILENICQNDDKTTAIFHSRNFDSQNAFTSGMLQSQEML